MSIPKGIETINMHGREHPLFGSVLKYAREECGLRSLTVELLREPTTENGGLAIVRATAVFMDGEGVERTYSDLGEASPGSLTPQMRSCCVRMSSTRAKGRALRDGCGISDALYEEMHEEAGQEEAPRQVAAPRQAAATGGKASSTKSPSNKPFCKWEGCGVELTQAEVGKSWSRFKKQLCKDHFVEMEHKLAAHPAV